MTNKIIYLTIAICVGLFIACTDSSSTDATGDNVLSPPYGIIPIDTTIKGGSMTDNGINGELITTSASKTEYRFNSTKTVLRDDRIFITAYYEENGLSAGASDSNGAYLVTYRLLNSVDGNQFVGLLWNNAYWSKNCTKDSSAFYEKCIGVNGEFMNYNEDGCRAGLQVSCVYPMEYDDPKKALNQLADEFLEYAFSNWNEQRILETDTGRFETDKL